MASAAMLYTRMLQRFTVRRMKWEEKLILRRGSARLWMLAYRLLEGPSCTLRRVLECFEIDTGVAMMLFSRASILILKHLSISMLMRLFSTEPHKTLQNPP